MSNPELDIYADIVDTFTQDHPDEAPNNQSPLVPPTTISDASYKNLSAKPEASQLQSITTPSIQPTILRKTPEIVRPIDQSSSKRALSVYVGNLTWWTKDSELIRACQSIGVNDIVEVKFFENRTNGQSKGIANVTIESEESYRQLLGKLPEIELNGQKPQVTPANRQALIQMDPSINSSANNRQSFRSHHHSPPIPRTGNYRHRNPAPIMNQTPLSIATLAAAIRSQSTQQSQDLFTAALNFIRPALSNPYAPAPPLPTRDNNGHERNVALANSAKKRADAHVDKKEYQSAVDTINQAISIILKSPEKDDKVGEVVDDLKDQLEEITAKWIRPRKSSKRTDTRRSPPSRYPRYSSPNDRSTRHEHDNHSSRRSRSRHRSSRNADDTKRRADYETGRTNKHRRTSRDDNKGRSRRDRSK